MSKVTQVTQVLSKVCSSKLWPETEFALVHLSYEEAAVFVHRKVFVTKELLNLHRLDKLKNFAANNLL